MERRLSAILAADMVGFSRLMANDETGTIARQKAHRSELIDPKIAQYGGRIVKTTGDGLLVEFGSVIGAVECAIDVQRSMVDRETDVADERRISYRIGINLGDIVIDGEDILGDGVNVAARLESLSPANGICISDMVYQNLLAKIDAPFADLGEQSLKNIEREIRVWQWVSDSDRSKIESEAKTEKATSASSRKTTIAVLPFTNMSGDPEQEFFADGLAEDIITELAREPDLFVIARNSSFAYKGQSTNIRDIGQDLGAHYVLEGSVRKAGDRIRLTAQLIDAQTDHHVWAERYDRALADVFEVQDELTSAIYSTLLKKMTDIGFERAARRQPADLDAYDLVQRAFGLMYRLTRADNDAAIEAAQAALALAPRYARAHTALAWAHIYRVFLGQADDPKDALEKASAEAQKAIDSDQDDYWSHGALGGAELWAGRHDRALAALKRAVELGPNSADMRALNATVLNYIGRAEEALADVELAIRLNPHHPSWYLATWGRTLFNLGRHEEAEPILHRLTASGTEFLPGTLLTIANYMAIHRLDDARDAVQSLLRTNPDFTLAQAPRFAPFKNRELLDRYLDLLREAGVPN